MAETITPEQRARDVATFLNIADDGIAHRVITAAIRAAETAAVDRCAKDADEMAEAAKLEFGALSGLAIGASAVALHLRATTTTETPMTANPSLIDTMARAIGEHYGADFDASRHELRSVARAALRSLLEAGPTEAMIAAYSTNPCQAATAVASYRSMLRAALEEADNVR